MIWTDEADEILIRLWDEGKSLSYVTAGMNEAGYSVTRNAIAGRKHRLPPEAFKRIARSQPVVARSLPATRVRARGKKPMTDKEPKEPKVDPMLTNKGVEYLELPAWGCKAILNERSEEGWKLHKVCGLRRVDGSPYCRGHLRLYTNATPYRKGAA